MKKILTVADMGKVYVSVGDRPAVKRLCILAMKQLDQTGKNFIEFKAKDLADAKIYADEHCAKIGLDSCVAKLAKVRVGRSDLVFSKMETLPNSFKLYLNPQIDVARSSKGFRAFPVEFLGTTVLQPKSKARDLVFAIFAEAQRHADELVDSPTFDVTFKELLNRMGWRVKHPNSEYLSGLEIKAPLENAISKLMELSDGTGVVLSPVYVQGRFAEYLEKSVLHVSFVGDLRKEFLSAFGLKPAATVPVSSKPNPEIIFENPYAQPIATAFADVNNISAQFGWLALNCDDVCHRLEEPQRDNGLHYSLKDLREVLLNLESRIDHTMVRYFTFMVNASETEFGREYYKPRAIGELTFWLMPMCTIIRETVEKLIEANMLDELADLLTVKYLMATTDADRWLVIAEYFGAESVPAEKEAVSC